MNVLITPIPVFSQSVRSCLLARRRMQPLPAIMTGRFDSLIISNAWSTILSSGTERRKRRGAIGAPDTSMLAMSSGSSMCTAPGFSVRARRTALRTISGKAPQPTPSSSGWQRRRDSPSTTRRVPFGRSSSGRRHRVFEWQQRLPQSGRFRGMGSLGRR